MSAQRSERWERPTALTAALAAAVNLPLLAEPVRENTLAAAGVAVLATALLTAVALQLHRRAAAPPLAPPRWWPVAIGALALAGAGFAARNGATDAIVAACTILIAASTAAVVAAGPVSLLLIRGSAERKGIALPSSPRFLAPQQIGAIALDAHRTVTTGSMQVTAAEALDADHLNNLLFFAGALARSSDKRFAQALARRAGRGRVTGFREINGERMTGSVDRHPVRIGPPEWVGLPTPPHDGLCIGVEVDHRALGVITVDDELRPDGAETASRLQAGAPLTLLTDVGPERTEALAVKVGISSRIADAGADVRHQHVLKAQRERSFVLFAGESNDLNSPALDHCDLAITTWSEQAPARPHAVQLTNFSIATVEQGLNLLSSLPSRMRPVRLLALGLSLLGAAVAATGILPLGGAVAISLISTAAVVGLAVLQARGATATIR